METSYLSQHLNFRAKSGKDELIHITFHSLETGWCIEVRTDSEVNRYRADVGALPHLSLRSGNAGWDLTTSPRNSQAFRQMIRDLWDLAFRAEHGIWSNKKTNEIAHALKIDLIRKADPQCRATALRFLPPARFEVYRLLRNSAETYKSNINSLCADYPGVALFLVAIRQYLGDALVDEILNALKLRNSIKQVLDFAITRSYEIALSAREESLVGDGNDWSKTLWKDLPAPDTEQFQKMVKKHRLLILRAGPWVCPWYLLTPPPIVVVPEDIPRERFANARWYRTMKSKAITIVKEEGQEKIQRRLCSFLSKHPRFQPKTVDRVGEAYEFLKARGKILSCSSDPVFLKKESRRFSKFPRFEALSKIKMENPIAAYESSEIKITPIRDALAQFQLGERLSNCLQTLGSDCAVRNVFYFSVVIHGEELALEILKSDEGYTVNQFAGRFNRKATADERKILDIWFELGKGG